MPSSSRKAKKKMTQVLVPVSGPSSTPSTLLCSEELALPFGNGPGGFGEGMRSSTGESAAGKIAPDGRRAVTGSGIFTPDGQQKLAATAVGAYRPPNRPTTTITGRDADKRSTSGGNTSVVTPSEPPSPQSSRARIEMPNAFASVSLFTGETDFGGLSTSSDEMDDGFSGNYRASAARYDRRIPTGATATNDTKNGSTAASHVGPGRPDAPPLVPVEDEEMWKSRFVALCLYKSQHGHCLVPSNPRHSTPSERSLSMWVKLCREEYEVLGMPGVIIRMLTQERIDILDSIDFEWNVKLSFPDGVAPSNAANTRRVKPMSWNGRYDELLQFKSKYRDTNVPARWAANPDLAEWVAEQRRDYRRYTLADFCSSRGITEEQIDKLELIGFQWSETTPDNADAAAGLEPRRPPPPPPPLQNQYSSTRTPYDLSQGVATVSPSPMKAGYPSMEDSMLQTSSTATSSSNSKRKITPITPPNPSEDPDCNITGGPYGHGKGESQTSWDKHLDELLKYGEKNGTFNVSKSYEGGDLYDWVQYQRILFYRGEDEGRKKLGPAQRVRYDKLKKSKIFVPRGGAVDAPPVEENYKDKHPTATRSWDQSFAMLKRHFEEIGDVDIYYIADPDLYHWTNTVMIQYLEKDVDVDVSALSEKPLSDARYKKLKDLGIGRDWSHNDKLWHIMFHKLSQFELENGHCDVPGSNTTQLGLWIYRQRYSLASFIANGMKSSSFTHKRKAKLDGIGFDWKEYDKGYVDPDEEKDDDKGRADSFDQDEKKEDDADSTDSNDAQSLAERVGLPSGYTGKDLEKYKKQCPNCQQMFTSDRGLKYHFDNNVCINQNYTPKAPTYDFTRKQQDHNDKLWEENFTALCAYKRKHGNLEGGSGDDPLCKWAKRQRYECREWMSGLHTRFNAERKRKLDRIGFDFKGYDGKPISAPALKGPKGITEVTSADHQWNQSFFSLVEFKNEHGHFEGISPINEVLGRWVYKQRYNLRSLISGKSKGNFSIEKKEVLDSIDFDWQGYDEGWEKWKRASARKSNKSNSAAAPSEAPPRLTSSIDIPEGGACPGCKQVFHSKSGWLYHVKNGVCGVHACTRCRMVFKAEKNLRKHEKNVDCKPWTYEQAKLEALNAIMDAPSTLNDGTDDVEVLDEDYKFDNCCECGILEKPGDQMLLCDRCNLACHLQCTHDNLTEIPERDWFCRNCVSKADKLDYCIECGIMEKPDGPPMLLCDGCDVCCHVKCTHDGLTDVPDDEWFCRKCTAKRSIRLGEALAVENYAPPSFEDLLEKLKVFRGENGHFDVPPELEELHQFAEKLRESYLKRRKTALQLEHEEQLNKIGFNWSASSESSNPSKRTSSPVDETDETKMASKPSKSRKKLTDGMGLDSRLTKSVDPEWVEMLDKLVEYQAIHGEMTSPKGNRNLYYWLERQKEDYVNKKRRSTSPMSAAQANLLEKRAGFTLKGKECLIVVPDDNNGSDSDSDSDSDSEGSSSSAPTGSGAQEKGAPKRKRNDSSSDSDGSGESKLSTAVPRKNSQNIILIGPSKTNHRPPEYCGTGCSHGERQPSWDSHLEELLEYGREHGTYNVSKRHGDGDLYNWLQYQRYLFYKGERDGRSKGLGPAQRERYDKLKKVGIFIPLDERGGGTKRKRDEIDSGESNSGSSDSDESSTVPPQKRQRQNSKQVTLVPPPKKGNPKPPTYDSVGNDGVSKGESQKSWDKHLHELLKYGEKNGTYNVGKSYKGGDLCRWLQHQKWLFYKGEDEGRSKGLGPGQRHRYDKLKEADIFETR